jgi:drug/metabolite transporter (DMT)-like permease
VPRVLAVALGLASALSWGLADFLAGLQSRRHPVLTVLAFSQLAGTVALGLLVVALGRELPSGSALAWAVSASVGGNLALLAFYRALAAGTMSIVAPVSASGAALPVVVGIASGERPSGVQAVGLLAALVGIVLAAREEAHPDAAPPNRTALGLALLAAVGFGYFLLGLEQATRTADPLGAALAGRLGTVTVVLTALALLRPALPGPENLVPLVVVGLLDVGANALYALATVEGLLSVVSVLGSLYPAITVVLAHLVLGERVAPLQRAGVATVLGGVVLIAAG